MSRLKVFELLRWLAVFTFAALIVALDSAIARAVFIAIPLFVSYVFWRLVVISIDHEWMRKRQERIEKIRAAIDGGSLIAVKNDGETAISVGGSVGVPQHSAEVSR